ncbi:hypothetical protein VitviT2T_001458 [Vitis vinifera]|uniref:DNA-directed RNA polymerase n=1 Tax=Vitis vinifera TaxID=29760 RepID=A0ABY9BG09_VITVI|nr:hypothetical protein VitviT2T_001458 [Vitis vinifera]
MHSRGPNHQLSGSTFRSQVSILMLAMFATMASIYVASRAILELAEEHLLGKSGLHWLKIHLANLYASGVDKLSYEGCVAFTENHLEDIFDSADRPLEGRQALRSCPSKTTISHMLVYQDGSCNGLQHHAALGRDKVVEFSVFG